MENRSVENGSRASVIKDEVIAKIKDDGDFDRLRLKIIRKLKDDEELRNNIIMAVKQSAALNRTGAENMKPRQLSDAINEEVRNKVMSQMSDGLWKIIRSEDGMKSEIRETVQSVYDKLVNPGGTKVRESSSHDVIAARKEVGSHYPIKLSADQGDATVSDCEPKEPPGFYLCHNHDDNNHERQPQKGLQLPVAYNRKTVEESMEEPRHPGPPGFSRDDSDEDPDLPPGFA